METIGTPWMWAGFFAFVAADVAQMPVFLALGVVVLLIAASIIASLLRQQRAPEAS